MADWPAKRAAAFEVQFPIYDADGDLVTAASTPDSEVSKDHGTFTDCTNEAIEIATSSGIYYLSLTATEMTADIVAVITKTVTAGAKTAVNIMYTATRQLIDLAYPAVSGRSLAVDASGRIDLGLWVGVAPNALVSNRVDASVGAMAANVLTATAINADAITAAKVADGTIDAATFAAGAINAAAIATGAIDADAIAADAVAEIRSVVSGTADSGSTTTMVDAVRTEADTDYWKGCWILFTSGNILGQVRLITGFTPGTDTITFAPATTQAVATNTYEILPAGGVDVRLWLGSVVNALISGRVDANVQAMANDVITAAAIANAAIDAATFAAGAIDAAAIGTGAIDADAIAADAIGASELAADAATEIGTAVWATTTRTLTALGFQLATADFVAGFLTAALIATGAVDADALATDAVTEIVNAIFVSPTTDWQASAPVKSLGTAVMKAVHRIRDNAGTLEVFRADGTTLHASQTVTTDAGLNPIDELTGAA